ncbi:MAG TPA: DUF4397 domain-containing protein [Terriglobales bacterium]
MRKLLVSLAVSLSLVLFTVGCGDDPTARLRVVHASPDAPSVDVFVNGSSVLQNVAYETASSYLKVKAGTDKIEVKPTGSNTAVISASPDLMSKKDYTVLAVNYVSSIEPLLLTDDNTPPASGNVKVRIVHAAPSAPAVDVYVTAPGADLLTATPVLTNVSFKGISSYLSVPAGSYEVRVTVAGTKTVAIDSGSVSLAAGQIRTAVALDAPGGGAPFSAIVLPDLN